MDAIMNWIVGLDPVWIYVSVFLLLLVCGLGVPIPEDISLFAAGLACYAGSTKVSIMIPVTMAGVMIGDSFMYFLGARLGYNVFHNRFLAKLFPQHRLDLVAKMMKKRGHLIFFMARFMPGLRSAVFFSAGALNVPFRIFFTYNGLAALISVPLIVFSSYHFGEDIHQVMKYIRNTNSGLLGAIVLIIGVLATKYWLKKRSEKAPSP